MPEKAGFRPRIAAVLGTSTGAWCYSSGRGDTGRVSRASIVAPATAAGMITTAAKGTRNQGLPDDGDETVCEEQNAHQGGDT